MHVIQKMLYYNFIVGEKKKKKDFIQIKEYFRKNKQFLGKL